MRHKYNNKTSQILPGKSPTSGPKYPLSGIRKRELLYSLSAVLLLTLLPHQDILSDSICVKKMADISSPYDIETSTDVKKR